MKVLVLGANGATGFNVVTQLLDKEIYVKAMTRNTEKFTAIKNTKNLEIINASILDLDNNKLTEYLNDVDAVISCLGHNLTLKGIFGKPHNLVIDALKKIVHSLNQNKNTKLILMNTTGCTNKLQNEKFTKRENFIISILRHLVPPHRDNELALAYLIDTVRTNYKNIEWIAVRPDTLIEASNVTAYEIYSSHIRSPLFNPGKTSRINVANFMAELLTNQELWEKWKFKTPIIYNKNNN